MCKFTDANSHLRKFALMLDNVGDDRLNLPVAGKQLRVVPGDATTVNLFFPFLDAIVVTPVGEWVSKSFIISNLPSTSAIVGNLILPTYFKYILTNLQCHTLTNANGSNCRLQSILSRD